MRGDKVSYLLIKPACCRQGGTGPLNIKPTLMSRSSARVAQRLPTQPELVPFAFHLASTAPAIDGVGGAVHRDLDAD